MHNFVRKLITEWRRLRLPFDGERVIVAVSGGADSTALLIALADLREREKLAHEFIVAHFNHRLRSKESDTDELFVKKLANERGFEFVSAEGHLKGKSNLEQRAREERYAFLEKAAEEKNAAFVLTAHTINDQAETFLMNLVRGSGFDGLRAIPVARPLIEGSAAILVRPILSWAKREDTVQFCRDVGVEFRRDRMNDDLNFTRVKIRRSVLPELAKINPKIVESLARTAGILSTQPQLMSPVNTVDLSSALRIRELKDLEISSLYALLRKWLRESRDNLRDIEMKHIEAIARLVNSRKSGRLVELPGGGAVSKSGGSLRFGI